MTAAVEARALSFKNDPPADLQQKMLKRTEQIAMIPAVAMQALEIAKDPECSITKFAAVVERDVKLASDILGMANSVIYAPPSPIISLHQAVIRLGFRQCKNLILTSSIAGLMSRLSIDQQWVRELLWQHGFTTALAALNLNRMLNLGFQGEEFTAGLIHDLGRTLMAVLDSEQFEQVDPLTFEESLEDIERERRLTGTDHCSLGAWFIRWQGLPEVLSDVVRYHHLPREAVENSRLVALTAVADHLANHLQRFGGADGYEPHSNDAVAILAERSNPKVKSWFAETAHMLLEHTAKDAAEMMPSLS